MLTVCSLPEGPSQHTTTFACLLVHSVLTAWMAFIKPSLDQHSSTLIDVFAQGQTDHPLVSDAFFPLPLCLLPIPHFPFLPEQETNSTQRRPYAPSRESLGGRLGEFCPIRSPSLVAGRGVGVRVRAAALPRGWAGPAVGGGWPCLGGGSTCGRGRCVTD